MRYQVLNFIAFKVVGTGGLAAGSVTLAFWQHTVLSFITLTTLCGVDPDGVCANNTFMQSLPCVKGGAEGGGIVKSEKTIPQSLRDSPHYANPQSSLAFTSGNPVHKGALDLRIQTAHKSKFER